MKGVVAAGHPLTAEAGAAALRAGGNAVDAALGAMLASFAAEPLLTGLGAGGYMLVGTPDGEDVLLDFFVEAPGRCADDGAAERLVPVSISFGDAVQVFHVGPAACGPYGAPAGICAAHERFATLPLDTLAAPAIEMARDGVAVNGQQAYLFEILDPIVGAFEGGRALYWIDGRPPREGEVLRNPELADALELLAAEGDAPFYTGAIAQAVSDCVAGQGGVLGSADLASYRAVAREPVRVRYRGHEVLTNPPPSAGGLLLAYVLARLDGEPAPPDALQLVAAMEDAQAARTPEFVAGLARPGFHDEFLALRLGNTTHISVMDTAGWACSVTATNGAGSGVVVPGTGIQLNNMMGEADLSPLGFFTHPPGRRLPSMMAPTLVRSDGVVHLALGSAGSNRIRSAILQVISAVIDHARDAAEAVTAPRVHWEDGVVYVEPGIDTGPLEAAGHTIARFRAPNVFFGGCQAVERDAAGVLHGAGDPRRGGAAVSA